MSTRRWPLTSNDVIYWIWIAMELLCTAPYPAVVQVITKHKHKSTYIHTVNGHGWALHTTHLLEIPPHTTITHSVLIYCNCPDYKAAIKYSADELHYNNSENMLILVAKINYSLERKSKCSYVHYVVCCVLYCRGKFLEKTTNNNRSIQYNTCYRTTCQNMQHNIIIIIRVIYSNSTILDKSISKVYLSNNGINQLANNHRQQWVFNVILVYDRECSRDGISKLSRAMLEVQASRGEAGTRSHNFGGHPRAPGGLCNTCHP